jgi:Rrf2 family nitric oxide-sensitive transcriptional repressor
LATVAPVIFSTTTVHALRAVARLADAPEGAALLGRDLAREVALPPDYLSKILARLARAGVLEATRGARGGYRLARPPGRILLGEIVRPLEGDRSRPGCLLRPGRACDPETGCAAHGAWSTVKGAYLQFLETTTVADLGGHAPAAPAKAPAPRPRRAGHPTHRRRRST